MFRSFSAYNFVFLILVLRLSFNMISCDEDDESVPEEDSTLDKCKYPSNSTKKLCCAQDIPEIDNAYRKCMELYQKKMPVKNEQNPTKFISCVVECIYKEKKYIGEGDTINMQMVKSDAKELHKDDAREEKYMIEKYQYCEGHAAKEWGEKKKHPAARIVFDGSCKPYYMFVLQCVKGYGMVSCPHFKWKSANETVEKCEEMKEKCEQL